jgi:hypothetical protein
MVNKDDAEKFTEECDDGIDGLVAESVGAADSDFGLLLC